MNRWCRHIRTRAGTGSLLLLALYPIAAHSDAGYLPRIGPVPLRFAEKQLPVSAGATVDQDMATEVQTNTLGSVLVTNNLVTNVVGTALAIETNNAVVSELKASSGSPPQQPVSSFPSETSPLSGEILAELFKPAGGRRGESGVSLTLPIDAGFAPPQPKPSQSSTAVYKSE